MTTTGDLEAGGGERPWYAAMVADRARWLALFALAAILTGGVLALTGDGESARWVWGAAVAVLAASLTVDVGRSVVLDRSLGVDTVALVAMVGALALGEELAGVVVGLMFSGGAALEAAASKRARRELTALIQRAPVSALRRGPDGALTTVPVAEIVPGDVVLVPTGAVVPVDGRLASDRGTIDTSTLTGEPIPVDARSGDEVLSGVANAGAPFEVQATRPAAESAYSALVRLVRRAQEQRAPFERMADRYAGIFLPVTLLLAGAAWAMSGDPVRALAVVVVATPCPLILAAPIALVSGVSRAARAGVIVKGAGVVEALGGARTLVFDKTGTLTVGKPAIRDVITTEAFSDDEMLALAASADHLSTHVLASALVDAARARGLTVTEPADVQEIPGQGVAAVVGDRRVLVGSRMFLEGHGVERDHLLGDTHGSGEARVMVAVDGALAGVLVLADEARADAADAITRLRAEGIRHIVLASGDRRSVVAQIGRELGIDELLAEQTPESKLQAIAELRERPGWAPVVMVGDGVNDAPALAAADVGIAMGVAGATVSSETADAVITVDRIDRVADAVHAGRRALAIARQSVLVGMGLSIVAMVVAAFGYLPPIAGALLQEGIDLAVILNALRALRG